MPLAGSVVWNELMTPDVEKAKAFYAIVFGWTYVTHDVPGGVYTLAIAPGSKDPVAGLFPWPATYPGSDDWFAYFAVDDIVLAVRQARVAGGLVMREPWSVPGVGRLAIVADPVGARLGFLEAAAR
jgi:predicted enzyme related to lactoylglutathione lyase